MNLHNQNRIHTFVDVESGQVISLPKDGTDRPPVNADINNLITYGKTAGGEGTPSVPISLVNVAEWNLTVTDGVTPIVYHYRLEDTDGVLHYGGDLPDGTADTYNRDTGQFVERKNIVKVQPSFSALTGASWQREGCFSCYYVSTTISTAVVNSSNLRCTHFKGGAWEWNGKTFPNSYILVNGSSTSDSTLIYIIAPNDIFGIVAEDTDAQKLAKVNTWFTNNDVYLEYQLREPVTYKIKQYGKTYGGVVWEYNEKPKSIQYHTNIFTDKNITMQCEVRKLGNRAMGEYTCLDENGEIILDENDENIITEV